MKTSEPRISVITVTYNSQKYLEKCLESVAEQTYRNFEHIIVDGGSSDETLSILERHRQPFLHVVSESDNGPYDAMNKGTSLATGKLILFLNSDDYFVSPHSLQALAGGLNGHAESWCCGRIGFVDAQNKVLSVDVFKNYDFREMLVHNIIRHPACLMPQAWVRTLPFDLRFKHAADYLLMLRVWKLYGPPRFIDEQISNFRLDGRNLSSDIKSSIYDEQKARQLFRKEARQTIWIPLDWAVSRLRLLAASWRSRGR